MSLLVEVCVDSVESADAAALGGAARIELCDDLLEGGTTPSAGMIQVVRNRVAIGLHVLIRPRGGDFCYSDAELDVMERDIDVARRLGADGIVLGLLHPEGSVDELRTRLLVEAARPLSVTFHRAFDVTRDAAESLEALIRMGVDRLLTSGRARTALEGIPTIADLVRQSAGRIIVLAGGGIDEGNASRIVTETGVGEIHLAAAVLRAGRMLYRNDSVSFRKGFRPMRMFVQSPMPADHRIVELLDGMRYLSTLQPQEHEAGVTQITRIERNYP
jgi:copper homeostasis protein